MACNKLLKEAFDGIEIGYKLEDIINDMPDTIKMDANEMYNYLIKKGVSPKEIERSGIMNLYKDKTYKFDAADWKEDFVHKGKVNEIDVTGLGKNEGYDDVTLNHSGVDNPTYKETMLQIDKVKDDPFQLRHYPESENSMKSNMGWRREDVAEVNGKPSTVLHETQSDWAQYERDGQGVFKGRIPTEEIKELQKEKQRLIDGFEKEYGSSIQDYYINHTVPEIKNNEYITRIRDINKLVDGINKFPLKEEKFHMYNIVRAIDEAIKNGTNRVVIPIERETELVGSDRVTAFYDRLDRKILPTLQKQLNKQKLKIDIHREKLPNNEVHVIEIKEVPKDKPVKYYFYSILGALGLREFYNKDKKEGDGL